VNVFSENADAVLRLCPVLLAWLLALAAECLWDQACNYDTAFVDEGHISSPPYEEITHGQYEGLAAAMPKLDFAELSAYENVHYTLEDQEYAFIGNG